MPRALEIGAGAQPLAHDPVPETEEFGLMIIVASLNARLQPYQRVELFEDPLRDALTVSGMGSICGGGSLQSESGEIESCDLDVEVDTTSPEIESLIITTLEGRAAPKGSIRSCPGIPWGGSVGVASG